MSPPPHRPTRRQVLRTTGLSALALGTGLATSSCATAPTAEEDAGGSFRVYWNAGHSYAAYEKAIAGFEREHGIKVSLQRAQWPDLRTRLLADFAAGNVPDVVEGQTGWAQEFAISGDVLALDSYVDRDGPRIGYPDDWQPTTFAPNSYEGKVYGLQLHLTCSLLLYNKRMLDRAKVDPPTTWAGFREAAGRLTTGDVFGCALNQDAGYSWPWMLQNGVRLYDPKTRDLLTPRKRALEALEFQTDLVHRDRVSAMPVTSTDYSGPQKLFSAERTAMIFTGPWDLQPIAESSPDIEVGIAPALRHEQQATNQAGTCLFIPAKAKRPDLSWDFIKRLTTLDVERAATEESGMLMPRKSWAADPVVSSNQQYAAFAEGFAYAEDPIDELRKTGQSGQISELYKNLYQGVVMQKKQPADEAERFVAAATRLLDDA